MKRQSITFNEHHIEVLNYAGGVWPEHADNHSELTRQVIADWFRNRQDNGGGRMARIVALEARADDHDRRLDLIERHIERMEHANDFDHA